MPAVLRSLSVCPSVVCASVHVMLHPILAIDNCGMLGGLYAFCYFLCARPHECANIFGTHNVCMFALYNHVLQS